LFGQGLWWSTWDGVCASPADARGYAGRGGRPVARFGEHLVVAGPGGAWVLPREADLGRWGGAQPYVGVEDPVTVRADAGVLVVERATDTFGPTDLLRCEPGTGPLACEPFGPSAPRLHGVLHGSELVVAGYDHGLVVYDATDLPASLVGGWYGAVEEWSPTRLARVGDRVAVWDSASEQILHFDISDPSAPVIVPDFPALFASDELSAVGSWFFLAGDDAAALIDPADPTTPVWQAPSDAESPWVGSAALAGDALWLVGSEVEAFGVGTNGPAASMGEVMRWGPPERPLGTAGWRHTPAATEGTSAWATDYGFGLLGLRRDALGQAEAWARLPVGTHGITTVAVAAGAPWWTDGEGTLRTFARFQAPELTLDPSTPPRVGGEVLADVRFTPPTSGPSKLGCRVAVGACELSEVDLEAGTAKLRWLLPDFIGRHEVAVWWAAPDALMFGRLGVETPAE
jgi:hypothetical protein